MRIRVTTFRVLIAIMILGFGPVLLSAMESPQSDQDALFNQAVQAYQQNQFKYALQLFQQINGAHAQDAKIYVDKIKAYLEAFSAAATILQRNPNEQDPRSLEFAIEELHAAIAIKADGPGHPDLELQNAIRLKRQMETASNNSEDVDRSLCERARVAANEHRFKEASELSCLLAHDNPAYSCGGNEAVHVCQVDTDLAKMEKNEESAPITSSPSEGKTGEQSGDLEKARAAYQGNDFARARSLLSKITGEAKPEADNLLYKISNYNDSVSIAERLSREGKYEEARAAFLAAASIKPDGPGNPQNRAAMMELLLGVDQFYSGDYASAIQHLGSCKNANVGKEALVDFYLGASKLGKYFVSGGNDEALHQDALNDLKSAKQAGFDTAGHDVSPKILQAYNQL